MELNKLLNYWNFFETYEEKIQEVTNESLDVILYSKFYWSSRYFDKYTELFGLNAGIEQMIYKIIEEMDARLNGNIDSEFLQKLDEDRI